MSNYPSGYREQPSWDEYLEAQDAAIKNHIQKLEQQLSAITAERDALKARIEELEKREPVNLWKVGDADDYIDSYEFRGDVGDYSPTEAEKLLITDALAGFIEELPKLYSAPITSPDTQEWPKLDKPAKVGTCRFGVGVSARLVVESAKRLYEYEVTPEKEAERIANASALSFTDTQELIRKAVEEERERFSKIDKAEFIGEFSFEISEVCAECVDTPDDDCPICQGTGDYQREVFVPWTTIKEIHKAMFNYAIRSRSTKEK